MLCFYFLPSLLFTMIPSIKLSQGNKMPLLGLGTWQLTGPKCTAAVQKAIELGYNHIDTAQVYTNQPEVGKGISSFERSKIFITSKIWNTDLAADAVPKACDRILQELNTDYVDLLLVHWPNRHTPVAETLGAMQKLVEAGKARSLGVSNFTIYHLKEALESNAAKISVNQVEFHPLLYQKELFEFCSQNSIAITAYSPLARQSALQHRAIKAVAESNGKTPAQACLRWMVQKGIVVIPKASSEAHIKENMGIFGWQLSPADEKAIDAINRNKRLINPPFAEFGRGA